MTEAGKESDPASSIPASVFQLIEGSVDASVILDADRRILYYNRAYESMARLGGRKLRNAVESGAKCFEVFPLSICEKACVGCVALEKQRTIRVDEIEALGHTEPMTFIVTAAPTSDGHIIETYRDVTADVRIQRRLKELLRREREMNATLEEKVRERTKELDVAHAQLVLQEKMSTLGRLVAGIAHELNNPINFVYGNVEFLDQYVTDLLSLMAILDGRDDLPEALQTAIDKRKEEINYDYLVADCQKLIHSIRTGAERTATIVRDLKNFSRSGSGKLQKFDIVTGIETTLNLIAPLIKNRIEIRRNYAEGLPSLTCNGGHINQVFMNILTNAAQAISGEGWIDVSIEALEEGSQVRVTISDSGMGISEENRKKIAEPFFTTKEVGEGSGLGLWITLSIIRKHGGVMDVQSAPGKGATFTVTLPVTPPINVENEVGDFG